MYLSKWITSLNPIPGTYLTSFVGKGPSTPTKDLNDQISPITDSVRPLKIKKAPVAYKLIYSLNSFEHLFTLPLQSRTL